MFSDKQKANSVTRGGQITFHNIRMFMQIQGRITLWMFMASAICTLILCYLFFTMNQLKAIGYYLNFQTMGLWLGNNHPVSMLLDGHRYAYTLGQMKHLSILVNTFSDSLWKIQVYFLCSFVSCLIVTLGLVKYFRSKGEEQTADRFIRGVQIVEPKQLEKELKKRKKQSSLTFDKMKIFKQDFEYQHTLMNGTTGTGKSVALRKLLRWVKMRGDKAIVYDKGCTFTGMFYEPEKDVILNPFDERCPNWDVWCDAHEDTDFENQAAALIPQHGEGDPFWVLAARTIFASTAFKMRDDSNRSNERFLEMLLMSQIEDLSAYLKGTESSSLTSDKAAKIAISIKSILSAYIKSLRFLSGLDQPLEDGSVRKRFSIREWVQDEEQKGVLFLSSNAHQHASLRPLISMWLSIASTAILGLTPNQNRRVWVIMDEMPTLHKLPELAETIAEVRKFGGCYVVGIQSYAQLEKNYGRNAAMEMFDLLNTRFYFRAPSDPMAIHSSKDLGEQELEISKEQYSYGANTVRDGVSLGHQNVKRQAVTATQISQLEDLECWLKTAGSYPITKLQLHYDKFKQIAEPFIPREIHYSEKMNKLEEIRAYSQISAVSVLEDETKHKLFQEFSDMYSNDKEEQAEKRKEMAALEKTLKDTKNNLTELKQTSSKKDVVSPARHHLEEADNRHDKENEKSEEKTTQEMFTAENEIISEDFENDL
ncbi:type IV conjugative transfer system coupling protein TraD [Vibrio sp. S11_S32]|uniref:type IV conjugative transfer system coupling protein TraD n=1 Tax=Vibrio sp. S11_S32 TaxID=2720225 RepID=UPI0016813616|nr:type IV conjugative transfer system coupling protein TraD [Vibrio sp. S11_S32]MBD1576965.1 type IV conjugative transfer system coupling protein TraD [Vibrio sp. S11_S32]